MFTAFAVSAPTAAFALDREDGQSLTSILEAADDEPTAAKLDQDPTWLIRDVLRWDFARTPSAQRQVLRATDRLRWQRERRWLDEVDRRATLARLYPKKLLPSGTVYDIPMMEHALVDAWIEHFTGRGRRFFERALARADRYAPIMQPILEEAGLPRDTIYLAMIESGFVSHALSRSRASGFWQFIASTGQQYKLRQDSWVDERRDFIKATKSAAKYLGHLYKQFGDWHLAWAGYNAGGGRVSRALAKHEVDDFWTLIEQKDSLAKETQHYVPKIIAAAIVAKNRDFYGFGTVESLPVVTWEEVTLDDAVELRLVAKQIDVAVDELRSLNPELLYDLTPPGRPYALRVPVGTAASVGQWLAALPRAKRFSYGKYEVRPGDTLGQIAVRNGSTIRAISEFNSIHNVRMIRPGQRLIIPMLPSRQGDPRPAKAASAAANATEREPPARAAMPKRTARATPAAQPTTPPVATHVVTAGDTLWSIARRYNVSVGSLKSWNRRSGSRLSIGDVLMIF